MPCENSSRRPFKNEHVRQIILARNRPRHTRKIGKRRVRAEAQRRQHTTHRQKVEPLPRPNTAATSIDSTLW